MPNSAAQLQRLARKRADDQARRIAWQRLHDARNQYVDWQEFYFWSRSILEVEEGVPDSLSAILNDRCPGLFQCEERLTAKAAKAKLLVHRLENWIDEHVFEVAKKEGWFSAIAYYGIRDPRYQRAQVCWSECVEKWKKAKPIRYPSFEEWQALATQCDEAAHLTARERKAQASAKLVRPDRLNEAVARYMDYEALAYWARPALERRLELPQEVADELERRCPGYLSTRLTARKKVCKDNTREWELLMLWIGDHFFQDAHRAGWFDAIHFQVGRHPRAIRTMEYADSCDELWLDQFPSPYPAFEDWRNEADSFVDLSD
jgi:hypothetical protein